MATAQPTTDHDEIRQWVEERGGHPARVKQTGSRKDPGILRIDFPGFSGEDTLEELEWDEWFDWFDRNKLALLLSEEKGNRFNKLVSRGRTTAAKKSSSKKRAPAKKAAAKKSASKKAAPAKKAAKKAAPSKKSTKSAKKATTSSKKATASKKATSSKKATTKRATSNQQRASASSAGAKTTTNKNTIRKWVEARGGFPAHVKRTGKRGDPGVLRIDYPGFSGKETLERMDWDEWFDWFDRNKLAFLYQDKKNSRFSKLVAR